MHSLFLKIFLWFWAAMALIGLAFIAVEATTQAEQAAVRWRRVTGDAFTIYAREAAENFETDGKELSDYLAHLEEQTHIRAWLFDTEGRIVHNALPPRAAADDARIGQMRELVEHALSSGKAEFEPLGSMTLAALRITSPTNRHYVLVGQLATVRYGLWDNEPPVHLLRLLAVLMAATLLCWGLARHLTEPILSVRAVAQQLAAGDLTVRADARLSRRQDELGELAQEFDGMAARLEALVSGQNQLMQAQQRLLADVSHELRSPLARLGVALDMAQDSFESLANGDVPEVGLDELLARIQRESVRLNEMIARLLTLSRLESRAEGPGTTLIDLAALVRAIVADANFEASSVGRSVRLIACQECTTQGTADLLRSAIENVVRNAVRYTPETTAVDVSLVPQEGCAYITVRDYGTGVPTDSLHDIFEPFYRVSPARERTLGSEGQKGGEGLGLSITVRAVQLHGGEVWAENASTGGLIVHIRLPCLYRSNELV